MKTDENSLTKPIPGYETRYVINTRGEVFSLRKTGNYGPSNPKKLRVWDYPYGGRAVKYMVNLCRYSVKCHYVIDLVALTFIGPPPSPVHRACPKNGNWDEHNVENIEYQTFLERGLSRKEERAIQMKQDYERITAVNNAQKVIQDFEANKNNKLNLEAIKKELFPDTYDKLTTLDLTKALIEFGRRKREAEEAQTKETV